MGEIRSIKRIPVKDLKPYENNAKKHGERQIERLAASIQEFGFVSPILIDKDNVIIAGHGRFAAATRLGLEKVPCVCVEGLTEDQKKAYILADNRLSELDTSWDMDLVQKELESISLDFDISSFDFKLPELPPLDDGGYYGDERERTNNAYNLGIAHKTRMTDGFWQMPIIYCDDVIPSDLIGFNYAKTSSNKNAGIHFYVDDYQFERIWNYPEKYIDVLKEYECILSPDFSLYMDMPMPMKIWNVYRSRQIGAFYQNHGIAVIPTISWAEKETFDFAFEGIPEGSIVSVSTIGVKENKEALQIWKDGMDEMIKRIKPCTVLVYGGALDYDYGDIEIIYFENKVTENWKS